MACPHVSGGAALVLERNPSFLAPKVLEELLNTARTDEISGLFPSDTNKELFVGEGGAPQPVPTPAPPPGTWEVSGSGCTMSGSCVSSSNHPSNYGNNEQCTISLYGEIPISVEAFNTEARYDFLTMGGTQYSGSSGPSSGTYSGFINWNSDFSIVTSGWRLCRTDQAADVSPRSIPLNVADCGGPNTIATLSGYSPTSVEQGQENFVNAWGTISEDVTGGTMNLNAAMTGFPWTNLGSIRNHNICTPATLELRALGIWGGTIDFDGLACPVLK